jgi:hypothetical protein
MWVGPHRNSIGKSARGYKRVINGLICDKPRGRCDDLYVFLMRRNDNPHRFFIGRRLSASSLRDTLEREHCMFDLILLAMGLGFFALSIGYAYACDRL